MQQTPAVLKLSLIIMSHTSDGRLVDSLNVPRLSDIKVWTGCVLTN